MVLLECTKLYIHHKNKTHPNQKKARLFLSNQSHKTCQTLHLSLAHPINQCQQCVFLDWAVRVLQGIHLIFVKFQ